MKYLLLTLLMCSCQSEETKELDIYFNSAQTILTKKFDIKIAETNKRLFDTVIDQSTIDTYRKVGQIIIGTDKIYKISVNGIDTTIHIKMSFNKIFIGYKDYAIQPENLQNSISGSEDIDLNKNKHRMILSLEK
ncbi:hypothetical protein [Sphingobacterium faecium]|uniref:hypothetical protein n=1 Tax=Sphingobacterium faecium TaxID=34087 RepID=UPI0024698BF6|nr:hypothetical protein [Sphingobacterium faecium]MDH5826431.1 hypothetical protein [Sphingobacterium faecium]